MPDAATSQGNNPDDRTPNDGTPHDRTSHDRAPQDRPAAPWRGSTNQPTDRSSDTSPNGSRDEANEVTPPVTAAGSAAVSDETGATTRPVVSPRREPGAQGLTGTASPPRSSTQMPIPTSTPMISTATDDNATDDNATDDNADEGAAREGAAEVGAPPERVGLPADNMLVDDVTLGSDLTAKVGEAWHEFARHLAGAISGLPRDAHLDITLDPTATGTGTAIYEVSVQHHADDRLGALAVGNATLPDGARLSREAVAQMIVIGWSPPGVVAGSDKDFGLTATAGDAAKVAVIVTKTLRDVYGSPHPAFLTYAAHDADGATITIEPLGSARVSSGDQKLDALRLSPEGFAVLEDPTMTLLERVKIVVAGLQRTEPEALQVDSDGDIGVRSGSAMVFVRVRDNPPLIDVFSPILTDVEASEKLYAKLSELTTKMPIGRLYQANKTVWASVPVFGRDFQPTHLMLAVQVMTGLADELDDRLHGEFGGKRFFGEGDTPVESPEANTGMYL
jgi:hypothetical protein